MVLSGFLNKQFQSQLQKPFWGIINHGSLTSRLVLEKQRNRRGKNDGELNTVQIFDKKIMCRILDSFLLTKPFPSFLLRKVAGCSYVTLPGTELSIPISHSVFSKMCSKGNKPGIPPRYVVFIALCDWQQGVLYTFHAGVNIIRTGLPRQQWNVRKKIIF